MKRRAAALAASFLLAAGIAAVPATAASADSQSPEGFMVEGTNVNLVSLDGDLMTLEAFDAAAAKADSAGGGLHLVVDPSAATRGYLVAFSDAAAASKYMVAHGMGELPSSDREPAREAATAFAKTSAVKASATLAPLAALSVCSLPNHMGYIYDYAACGGPSLGIGWNEALPDLRVYGWNDRAASAALGDCIGSMTIYPDIYYGGTSTSIRGFAVYTSLPLNYNNTVSSYKTTVAGPCA